MVLSGVKHFPFALMELIPLSLLQLLLRLAVGNCPFLIMWWKSAQTQIREAGSFGSLSVGWTAATLIISRQIPCTNSSINCITQSWTINAQKLLQPNSRS